MKKLAILIVVSFISWSASAQLNHPMQFMINSPGNISGEITNIVLPDNDNGNGQWGPTSITTITGDLEWVVDSFGCNPLTSNLTGKIALIRRGTCMYSLKVYHAQQQGAMACVIIDHTPGTVMMGMLGGDSASAVTIPSIFLSYEDGEALINEVDLGNTVNASFYVRNTIESELVFAYKTPIDQIKPLQGFNCSLYNNSWSGQNMVTTLEIKDPQGNITSFSTEDTIAPLSMATVHFSGSYTPTTIGTYYGTFKSSLSPWNPDSIVSIFEITQDTFSLDNGDLTNATGIGLDDATFISNSHKYHQGAIYYTGSNGFTAGSLTVSFALENAGTYLGEQFSVLLYKAPLGGFLGSEQDYTSFTVVGTQQYTITVSDTMLPHLLLTTDRLFDPTTFNIIDSLDSDEEYMVVIKYQGSGSISESPKFSSTHNQNFLNKAATLYTDRLYMQGLSNSAPVIRLNFASPPCTPTTFNFSVTANNCSGYTVPSKDSTYMVIGTHVVNDTINNAGGCDSVMTITINIESLNQSVTATNPTFCTANSSTTITTDSSSTGINYYLRNNTNNSIVAGPIAGTGTGLTFNTGNIDSTTTYNVYARDTMPGTALDFDGLDDYVEITTHTDFEFEDGDFAIEAWIKTDTSLSTGVEQAVIANTNGAATVFWLGRKGNHVVFNVAGTSAQTISISEIHDGEWHHIAGVRNAGAIELYVDGVMDGSGNVSSNSLNTSSHLSIGHFDHAFHFNGQIDDVRFWNTARTEYQIAADMNTCIIGSQPGLVAAYNFEEGTGGIATDMSGNGHDGSLYGMDATNWVTGTSNCPTCDLQMTQTATVTINFIDSSVTQTGALLSSNETGATYQWIDCSNNTAMAGDTSQTFTATANGSYKVAITKNGCTDTSTCQVVTSIGIIENDFGNALLVYPNPTNGSFSIEFKNSQENITVNLLSLSGQLIKTKKFQNNSLINLDIDEPKGLYLLEITNSNGYKTIFKLVKE
ncbi:MAG: T9SS type A sorting domain-containing protein [Flavobacteriales bacterium]|nr:T9SS type A sorting domain-containing protein [Flavobacteriales bacterium]